VRFCRMTGLKKTPVDSRRASSSRAAPVGPNWREFTCLPLKHMVAWKAYAAVNPEERAWIRQVGLEGFVNLPWGQPIRKDVVENFINTAHSTKQHSIIGEVMGKTYVITPVDITNILRLPTGTTTKVNPEPDAEKFKHWSIGPNGHELLHRPDTDG
jgi:hypothetical protein